MMSSVAIGGFIMRIVVDGVVFQFENVEDLERLSRDDAMKVLEHLLFVERPSLLLEASKVPHLQQQIKKLTEEKDFFFRRKAQSIEDLSAKIVIYHNENEALNKEIARLNESIKFVNERYDDVSTKLREMSDRLDNVVQPISARQIASTADEAALNAIFPECRKKPYCIRSYSNLLSFLSKPDSDEFTGPLAPDDWLGMDESKRAAIVDRARKFAAENPYLKVSIKTLKAEAWKQAHSTTTVKETVSFYRMKGDEEACEAVNVCATFLNLPGANESTEHDDDNLKK